jgi:pantothenate kinase
MLSLKKTWEPEAADTILERISISTASHDAKSSPFMVALIGIPGSGKSSSAQLLADELTFRKRRPMIMPHDGYHIALANLPNQDAIYRRGAPDTFDVNSLLMDLEKLKNGPDEIMALPGFDHAVGDPAYGAHIFERNQHDVVICEGLYLLHNDDGWEKVKDMFDFCIYIESNIDACIERLKVRNSVIPGYTLEELHVRCDAVDRVNAMMVQRSRNRADMHVSSYDGTTGDRTLIAD